MISMLLLQIPLLLFKPLPNKKILRSTDYNYIVLHSDEGSGYVATRKFLIKKGNSYHYYIQRNGDIIKLVDPKYQASHAGLSYYKGKFRLNKYSIGIAFQNEGTQQYTEKQYISGGWLIKTLQQRYPDSTSRTILGHSDIAIPRGRKKDPGNHFDWNKLNVYIKEK